MPTNKDLIRMHLDQFVQENPGQTWNSLMTYCIGYYEEITLDIVQVIRDMEREGKLIVLPQL